MDKLEKIIEVIKFLEKNVWMVAIASVLLLVLPSASLSFLHINDFVKSYDKYIGIVFLISTILVVIDIFLRIWRGMVIKLKNIKDEQVCLDAIEHLDHGEKAILREFVIQGRNVIELPIGDPAVTGFIKRGILVQVIGLKQTMNGCVCTVEINEKIKNRITPAMIDLPEGEPSDSEKNNIMRSRPRYMEDWHYYY